MYSTAGNSAQYYVPLQDAATPPCKRQKCSSNSSKPRILSKRYPLTATGYKFLEVGVNVGPPSYVEIIVGDQRGNELTLSLETWKGLYEHRFNIERCLQHTDTAKVSIRVGPLTVRFATIANNVKVVRLESSDVQLMMTESTVTRLFTFDSCVTILHDQLDRLIADVDVQFTQFSHITSTVTNPKDVPSAIRASEFFNDTRLIDCELVALLFTTTTV